MAARKWKYSAYIVTPDNLIYTGTTSTDPEWFKEDRKVIWDDADWKVPVRVISLAGLLRKGVDPKNPTAWHTLESWRKVVAKKNPSSGAKQRARGTREFEDFTAFTDDTVWAANVRKSAKQRRVFGPESVQWSKTYHSNILKGAKSQRGRLPNPSSGAKQRARGIRGYYQPLFDRWGNELEKPRFPTHEHIDFAAMYRKDIKKDKRGIGITAEENKVDCKFWHGRMLSAAKGSRGRLPNPAPEIGNIILQQMGGTRRMSVMLGPKFQPYLVKRGVAFQYSSRPPSQTGNTVTITLKGDDTYKMVFSYWRNLSETPIKTYDGIYFDQLVPLFEKTTGLALRLKKNPEQANPSDHDLAVALMESAGFQITHNNIKSIAGMNGRTMAFVSNALTGPAIAYLERKRTQSIPTMARTLTEALRLTLVKAKYL